MSVDGALLARRFADIIGGSRVLTDPEAMAAFQQDWRGRYRAPHSRS